MKTLFAALLASICVTAFAQPATTTDPKKATPAKADAKKDVTKAPDKKAADKKAPGRKVAEKKAPPKKAADPKKAEAKKPQIVQKIGTDKELTLRDKQGNVIPTSPDAYDVSSALPPKKK